MWVFCRGWILGSGASCDLLGTYICEYAAQAAVKLYLLARPDLLRGVLWFCFLHVCLAPRPGWRLLYSKEEEVHSTAHVTLHLRLHSLCVCFVSSASRSAVRASERRTARRANLLGHRTLWALPWSLSTPRWSLQSLPCRLSDLNQYAYLSPPTGVCIACVLPVPSAFSGASQSR